MRSCGGREGGECLEVGLGHTVANFKQNSGQWSGV